MAASIEDLALGEAMHSAIGPWEEAQAVYIAQSDWERRLAATATSCVVYDVGLGIAANALSLVERVSELRACGLQREVHLVSFENQLEGLELALQQEGDFPFLIAGRDRVRELLNQGEHRDLNLRLTWTLMRGDFTQTIQHAPSEAEVVYYDFYSPRKVPELWTVEIFSRLIARSSPRGGRWISYCSASGVRAALRDAGYCVQRGRGTLLKRETTIASWGNEPVGGSPWRSQLHL